MDHLRRTALVLAAVSGLAVSGTVKAASVQVEGGRLAAAPDADGVRAYKGIPYAAPPVGTLRWRAPQPVAAWEGERRVDQYGPRCTQAPRLGDIDPLNPRMGEDCLYLNVWTPARDPEERLPVMVWIHGGSYNVGAGSEPWYDGAHLARRGVVVVTINYRLDVFGFLAHPELSAESPTHASGNWGLLDQVAALGWVARNIAAFGGDPARVTIFGESAGSLSVSALMASPRARGLFRAAIGQSGAILYPAASPYALATLPEAERAGLHFAELLGARSLAELRATPAEEVLRAAVEHATDRQVVIARLPNVDGDVLPARADEIFRDGRQTSVPLLAGSNSDEGTLFAGRVPQPATPEAFARQLRERFGAHAEALLRAYPADTPERMHDAFAALLGDQLISYPTWLWQALQARTGTAPVWRYAFGLRPPAPPVSLTPLASAGVFHTAEIAYVFDNLQVRDWPWRPEDRRMAELLPAYWVNFAKTGDPNGPGLPEWPAYAGPDSPVMRLGAESAAGPDPGLARYRALDAAYGNPSGTAR